MATYAESAVLYDALYRQKDYARETERLTVERDAHGLDGRGLYIGIRSV